MRGKTALAIVLAHRLKDCYPDAQLFLNLRGAGADGEGYRGATKINPVTPADAMRSVIHSFKPEAQLPETFDQLTSIYRSVLSDAGRVLLLLDNAANAEQVRPLLPPPNCLLLVTSRTQFQLPGFATRNLDYLVPEKSHELLLALSPCLRGYESEAADVCGHLPLALQVFAGAVNDKKLTPVKELVQRLRERRERLAPVDAAFQLSYELLDQELRRKCLIWFTVWSSVVHGGIMAVQSFARPENHGHLLVDVPALFIVAAILAVLTPRGHTSTIASRSA
jgi:hypothetical protein